MKRLILIAAVALALPACKTMTDPGLGSIPTSPSVLAQRTVADEQARLALELLYSAYGTFIDTIKVTPQNAAQLEALDKRVHASVEKMRNLYRTANSSDWLSAAAELRTTVAGALEEAKRLR
jgi:hypothetical protein